MAAFVWTVWWACCRFLTMLRMLLGVRIFTGHIAWRFARIARYAHIASLCCRRHALRALAATQKTCGAPHMSKRNWRQARGKYRQHGWSYAQTRAIFRELARVSIMCAAAASSNAIALCGYRDRSKRHIARYLRGAAAAQHRAYIATGREPDGVCVFASGRKIK